MKKKTPEKKRLDDIMNQIMDNIHWRLPPLFNQSTKELPKMTKPPGKITKLPTEYAD